MHKHLQRAQLLYGLYHYQAALEEGHSKSSKGIKRGGDFFSFFALSFSDWFLEYKPIHSTPLS